MPNHKQALAEAMEAVGEVLEQSLMEQELASAADELVSLLEEAGYDVNVESIDELIEDTEELLASGTLNEGLGDTLRSALDKVKTRASSMATRAGKYVGAALNTQAHQARIARSDQAFAKRFTRNAAGLEKKAQRDQDWAKNLSHHSPEYSAEISAGAKRMSDKAVSNRMAAAAAGQGDRMAAMGKAPLSLKQRTNLKTRNNPDA